MGEEKKEEENKVEEKKNEEPPKEAKKEEGKKEEEPQEIIIKVDMHCEACARKVARSLRGFQGVEEVTADYRASKVVVKGKTADPVKVCERIKKKSSRKVELISPLPKPPEVEIKEEKKEPVEEKKKEEPPAVVTAILKVRMHCEACAQVLQKKIRKIPGVESAKADLANEQVTVTGILDPAKLVDDIYKRTKKQVLVVTPEEKKEEEKKEEKKEEKEEAKKEGKEGKAEEEEEEKKSDIKKSEHLPAHYYTEYAYHPQFFSDENPNACSIM